MIKKIVLILSCLIVPFAAAFGDPKIISVTMEPSSPSFGDQVKITVNYCGQLYNDHEIGIAVSTSSTRLNADISGVGQVFVVSKAGVDVATSQPAINPGGEIGYTAQINPGGGTPDCSTCAGTNDGRVFTKIYNIRIPPASYFPGCSFSNLYLHVGMKDSNLNTGDWHTRPACSAYSAGWTVPVPAKGFGISKRAEGVLQVTNDMALFSVDYEYWNGQLVITDAIPGSGNLTLVSWGPQSMPGGSAAGPVTGTATGAFTWTMPDKTGVSGKTQGTVWMLYRMNTNMPAGTVISNTAAGTQAGSANQNASASIIVGQAAISILKAQSAANPQLGGNITYYLSYSVNGSKMLAYQPFDDLAMGTYGTLAGMGGPAVPGWSFVPQGGTEGQWQVLDQCNTGDRIIRADAGGTDKYPSLLYDGLPAGNNMCAGIITADVFIEPGGYEGADAMVIIRGDGVLGAQKFYSLVLSVDDYIGTNPGGNIAFHRCDSATCIWPLSVNTVTITSNKWWRVKIEVAPPPSYNQYEFRAKVWARGDPEPAAWAITWTDTTPPAGFDCVTGTWKPGLAEMHGAAGDVSDIYDNFTVFSPAVSAATNIWDTIPTGLNYMGNAGPYPGVLSGSLLRWNLGSLSNEGGTLTWWGTAVSCGDIANVAMIGGAGTANNSNIVTASVFCPSPTSTWTASPAVTPTHTPTATPTFTVTLTITSTPVTGAVCTPVSAVLCAAVDEDTDIYINGIFVDTFPFVNWDQTGVYPKCTALSVPQLASLLPTGNVIAVKTLNTQCCEMWTSWSLDVTCSSGHSFTSSNNGSGINMYHDNSACPATDAPNDGGGLAWYDPLYSTATSGVSWVAPVIVTGQKWGKRIWNPATGDLLPALGYSTTSPAGVMDCQQMFFRQGFSLVKQPTPLPPMFTVLKTSSQTEGLAMPGDVTFTVRVCNTGGGTFGSPVIVRDTWQAPSEWLFNGPYGSIYDTLFGQIDTENSIPGSVTRTFKDGFNSNSCYDLTFLLKAYAPGTQCITWANSAVAYLGSTLTPAAVSTVVLSNNCPLSPPVWTFTKSDTDTTVSMNETHFFNLEFCNTGGAAWDGTKPLIIVEDYSGTGTDDWQWQGPYYISAPATGIASISGSAIGKIITYTVTFQNPGFTGCYTIPVEVLKTGNGTIQACTWSNIGRLQYLTTPEIVSTVNMSSICSSPTYTPTVTPTLSATVTRTQIFGTATWTRTHTITYSSTITLTTTGTPPTLTPSLTWTPFGPSTPTFTATMTYCCVQPIDALDLQVSGLNDSCTEDRMSFNFRVYNNGFMLMSIPLKTRMWFNSASAVSVSITSAPFGTTFSAGTIPACVDVSGRYANRYVDIYFNSSTPWSNGQYVEVAGYISGATPFDADCDDYSRWGISPMGSSPYICLYDQVGLVSEKLSGGVPDPLTGVEPCTIPTATATMTPTATGIFTATWTHTVVQYTATMTPTTDNTQTLTSTPIPSNTCACTNTMTPATPSNTPTRTFTHTLTFTVTATISVPFTPTVTRTPACAAQAISVNLVYNPEAWDHVLAEITSTGAFLAPPLAYFVPHNTAVHSPVTVTSTLYSAGPAPVYRAIFMKDNAWGDVESVIVTGWDLCGNTVTSSGSYTKEVITEKNVSIFKNVINNELGERTRAVFKVDGGQRIRVRVFSKKGALIRDLLLIEDSTAGSMEVMWDGKNDAGENVVSGIYVISVDAGTYKATEKVAVVH